MRKVFLGLACALSAISAASAADDVAPAATATYAGTVKLNITGTFKTAVSPFASGECTGILALLPASKSATLTSLSLLTIFANLGSQQNNAPVAIAGDGKSFSCSVSSPYKFQSIDSAVSQLGVAYVISTPAGRKQQLFKVIPIPTNGATTTLSASVAF
jgi:hypothetical protein